jgi:hypothetical protein
MPYAFRLLFKPLGPALDAGPELALHTGAVIGAGAGRNLYQGGARLLLARGGYATEGDARADGEHHRLALYLAGPASGYPVDARDLPGTTVGRVVKEHALAYGVRVLDSPFGLQVYEEDPANSWWSMTGTGSVHLSSTVLRDGFASAYARVTNRTTSDEERTALELFNLAHVDVSPPAQFMTFITVVEVLATQRPRSKDALDFVEQCIRRLEASSLVRVEQDKLRAAFEGLRRESITSACQFLIAHHLDAHRADEFRKLYALRGRLTHDGARRDDLPAALDRLRVLVAELLMARFC